MSIVQQKQDQKHKQRAVSPPTALAKPENVHDEVLFVAARQVARHPGAPRPPTHGVKRVRSEDEESSTPERNDAQRTSSEKMQISMAKLVLCLIRTEDDSIIEEALPNLLRSLHERSHVKRIEKQQDFYSLGGHLAVVSVMQKCQHRKLLQQSGIIVLLYASYRNDAIRVAIGKVEGIQAILRAMKHFSEERDVQYQGLQALVNLMSERANAILMVQRLVAIPFILEKMNQYSDDGDILRWACELIKRLCRFNYLRPTIFEANAIETLANVLNTHKNNEKIQNAAREAIKLLL
jgi:hypothetical protein